MTDETSQSSDDIEVELDNEVERLIEWLVEIERIKQAEALALFRKTFSNEYKALRRHFEILLVAACARHEGHIRMPISTENMPGTIVAFNEHLNGRGYAIRMETKVEPEKLSVSCTYSNPRTNPALAAQLERPASYSNTTDVLRDNAQSSKKQWIYIITKKF